MIGVRHKKYYSTLKEQKSPQISPHIFLVYPNNFHVNLTLTAKSDRPKLCQPPKTPEKSSEFTSI